MDVAGVFPKDRPHLPEDRHRRGQKQAMEGTKDNGPPVQGSMPARLTFQRLILIKHELTSEDETSDSHSTRPSAALWSAVHSAAFLFDF